MNLKQLNRKAGMESQEVIVWILVISVVFLAIIFISRLNMDNLAKNLPGVRGPGDEDKEIDMDIETAICPEGSEMIGFFERGKEEIFLYIKDGEKFVKTDIYLDSGTNDVRVELPRHWNSKVGKRIVGNGEAIHIDSEILDRHSERFKKLLSEEFKKSKNIFYYLVLIDNAEIRSANSLCQDKKYIESIDKIVNELYFNKKDIEIVDLTGETGMRIQKDKIKVKRRFWPGFTEKEVTTINLANYIYYVPYEGFPISKRLIINNDGGLLKIYQYSDREVGKKELFRIDNLGFVWFNMEFRLREKLNSKGETIYRHIYEEDYFGWTFDNKVLLSIGAIAENYRKTTIRVDRDIIAKYLAE